MKKISLFTLLITILGFGIYITYIILKDIKYLNANICPICRKLTIAQNPFWFKKNGKLYTVHQGKCANEFLYGKNVFKGNSHIEDIENKKR